MRNHVTLFAVVASAMALTGCDQPLATRPAPMPLTRATAAPALQQYSSEVAVARGVLVAMVSEYSLNGSAFRNDVSHAAARAGAFMSQAGTERTAESTVGPPCTVLESLTAEFASAGNQAGR